MHIPLLAALLLQAAPKDVAFHFTHVRTHGAKWEAVVKYPVFAGDSAVIRFANKELARFARKRVDSFHGEIKQFLKDPSYDHDVTGYVRDCNPTVCLARPNLVSVYFESYEGTGGAHPNTIVDCFNFGLVGGKPAKLKASDLFKESGKCLPTLSQLIIPVLKERKASWVEDGPLTSIDDKLAAYFALTPGGITFIFEPYVVGSYAEGEYVVKFTYPNVPGLNPTGPLRPVLPKG